MALHTGQIQQHDSHHCEKQYHNVAENGASGHNTVHSYQQLALFLQAVKTDLPLIMAHISFVSLCSALSLFPLHNLYNSVPLPRERIEWI